ncbi:hypothetical protein RRG08_013180 [Elysia crispata]|uniref:Uncharacterized protein n=1 Tax=Elysia crispata TaxID=231223 RepID=A0AAE1DQ32_9GAST|nr:hypothetical protein RRG08_013180 [Elysia crispata]
MLTCIILHKKPYWPAMILFRTRVRNKTNFSVALTSHAIDSRCGSLGFARISSGPEIGTRRGPNTRNPEYFGKPAPIE